jgi:transcriptional regulator with XRE-family HTH domain
MTITFNAARLLELAAEHGDGPGRGTAQAIARRVSMDAGSISRYLSGKRQPDTARLALFAQAYGVQLDELMLNEVAA